MISGSMQQSEQITCPQGSAIICCEVSVQTWQNLTFLREVKLFQLLRLDLRNPDQLQLVLFSDRVRSLSEGVLKELIYLFLQFSQILCSEFLIIQSHQDQNSFIQLIQLLLLIMGSQRQLVWLVSLLKPKDSVTLILSLLIYFFIIFKIFQFFMHSPRKLSVKQRNQRRFIGAHKQILGTLTKKQNKLMDDTIQNTWANTAKPKEHKGKVQKIKTTKKVNFDTDRNQIVEDIWEVSDNEDSQGKNDLLNTATSLNEISSQKSWQHRLVQV